MPDYNITPSIDEDFTGKCVKDTYQSVIHVGTESLLFDGTGSVISIPIENVDSASYSTTSSHLIGFDEFSSSVEFRFNNLEQFSSSLDATFATDEELSFLSSSIGFRIDDLESFSSSLDNIYISQSGQDVVLGNITANTITASIDYSNIDNVPNFVVTASGANDNNTASFALNADSASYSFSSSYSDTAFYANQALLAMRALNADTASVAENVYVSQSGQDVVLGNITANTITTDTLFISEVTRSVIYDSGSTRFGDTPDDIHEFTGSLLVDGRIEAISITASIDYSNIDNVPDFALEANISGAFYEASSSIAVDISNLQLFSSSLDNIYISQSGQDVTLGNIVAESITASIDYSNIDNVPSFVVTASGANDNNTASFALNADSSSYSLSSSYSATASYVDLSAYQRKYVTVSSQGDVTYILNINDAGTYIRMTNANAKAVTVPPQSDVAWVSGTAITIRNAGAGSLTLTEGSGVTLNPDDGSYDENATIQLIRVAENEWDVI